MLTCIDCGSKFVRRSNKGKEPKYCIICTKTRLIKWNRIYNKKRSEGPLGPGDRERNRLWMKEYNSRPEVRKKRAKRNAVYRSKQKNKDQRRRYDYVVWFLKPIGLKAKDIPQDLTYAIMGLAELNRMLEGKKRRQQS